MRRKLRRRFWAAQLGRRVHAALCAALMAIPQAGWTQARPDSAHPLTAISGLVTDPDGAVVRGASVRLIRQSDGAVVSTSVSGLYGVYRVEAPAGVYRVMVLAAGFAPFESDTIQVADTTNRAAVANLTVDTQLKIAPVVEDVEVPDATTQPAGSGRGIVLTQRDLEQMPLDPVALMNELTGLAGSATPQIFVDGFSGGRLPSRNNIREIRINQNPYSAENDTDTVSAVIQVMTKPGTNEMHGNIYAYGDDSALNAKNPFAPEQTPYYADGAGAELSGAAGHRTNAYGRFDDLQQKTNAAVDALVLGNGVATPALYAVPNPQITVDVAARTDVKVSGNDTLILRYSLHKLKQSNEGVGQLALASQGLTERTLVNTLQAGNTVVLGSKLVEESRLQYIRTRTVETPASTAPTLLVQGAFTGGGNPQGPLEDHQDRVELQQNLSVGLSRHFVALGGRLRMARDANSSRTQFNGEFVFANLAAYETTVTGQARGLTAAQISATGGGASQYIVGAGDPSASATVIDGALFAQDNWKVRQNLKLSYGLRWETQNFIGDHADWAPRVGFSWGLGDSGKAGPRYVVHGGAGIFYQRLGTATALKVARFDGMKQRQYVVESPQFCPPDQMSTYMVRGCVGAPSIAALPVLAGTTIYQVSSNYDAPYSMEGSLGVDRPIGSRGTVGLTYLQTRVVHAQYADNANAPLPGTYVPGQPASGTRPDGNGLNVIRYESEGIYNTRQLTANAGIRSARYSLTGNYTLQFSHSNAESDGTFPLNRFDMGVDYGRSATDARHAGTLAASVTLPHGFSSWSYLRAASGLPFNIVVGDDLNGDTQYNDRPAFATDLTRASVVRTQWGVFDMQPISGQTIIPRNYGEGPGSLTLNLAVTKTYGFGGPSKSAIARGAPDPKYTAEFWVMALNVLNHPNLTQPVAVLGTPLFGRSVGVVSGGSLSPARALDLQLAVRF